MSWASAVDPSMVKTFSYPPEDETSEVLDEEGVESKVKDKMKDEEVEGKTKSKVGRNSTTSRQSEKRHSKPDRETKIEGGPEREYSPSGPSGSHKPRGKFAGRKRRYKVWICSFIVQDDKNEVQDNRIAIFPTEEWANNWLSRETSNFATNYRDNERMVSPSIRPFYLLL